MPWVYIDDHFDEHPKALAARETHRDAPWLFVAGLCYARRSPAAEGHILAPQVPRLISRYQPAAKKALLAARLWDEGPDDSIIIHDYNDWNRPAADRSASARNAAAARWRGSGNA